MQLRWSRVKSRYNSSYFMEGSQVHMGRNCIICELPQIDLANSPCSNVIAI
ncbi:unnamed protein product [Musa hybrid cultivar]